MLILWFEQRRAGPVRLEKTTFARCDVEHALEARRGAYEGFKWSSGLKALMVFLLRSASQAMREAERAQVPGASPPQREQDRAKQRPGSTVGGAESQPQPYVLKGGRPSLAASLNDVLTKRPLWIYDVFGARDGGLPLLDELVQRQNRDFVEPDRDVCLWLDWNAFPATSIEVRLNGAPLRDVKALDRLADDIARQWAPRGQKAAGKQIQGDHEPLLQSFWTLSGERLGQHMQMVFQMLADDAELTIVGMPELGMCGHWKGVAAIQSAVAANLAMMVWNDPSVHTVVTDENQVVVMGRAHGQLKSHARPYCAEYVQKLEFQNGRIVRAIQLSAPPVSS